MTKHRKRPQSPKRYTRHDNNTDKSRVRMGAQMRGERYDRNTDRSMKLRGEW